MQRREILGCAQSHLALDIVSRQAREDVVVQPQQATGLGQERVSVLGQHDVARIPRQQRLAKLSLQTAHLQADGRLRSAQSTAGPCEALLLTHHQESAHEIQVQISQARHGGSMMMFCDYTNDQNQQWKSIAIP